MNTAYVAVILEALKVWARNWKKRRAAYKASKAKKEGAK